MILACRARLRAAARPGVDRGAHALVRAQPDLVRVPRPCHMHRAELCQLHGDWSRALDEARGAVERRAARRNSPAWPRPPTCRARCTGCAARSDAAEDAYRTGQRARPRAAARARAAAARAGARPRPQQPPSGGCWPRRPRPAGPRRAPAGRASRSCSRRAISSGGEARRRARRRSRARIEGGCCRRRRPGPRGGRARARATPRRRSGAAAAHGGVAGRSRHPTRRPACGSWSPWPAVSWAIGTRRRWSSRRPGATFRPSAPTRASGARCARRRHAAPRVDGPRAGGAAAGRDRRTNRAIADELVLSERTVERHVTNTSPSSACRRARRRRRTPTSTACCERERSEGLRRRAARADCVVHAMRASRRRAYGRQRRREDSHDRALRDGHHRRRAGWSGHRVSPCAGGTASFVVLEAHERIGDDWRRPTTRCASTAPRASTRFRDGRARWSRGRSRPRTRSPTTWRRTRASFELPVIDRGPRRTAGPGRRGLASCGPAPIAFAATTSSSRSGTFQEPVVPDFAAELAPQIRQLHSSRVPPRRPNCAPGPVLVVGASHSGRRHRAGGRGRPPDRAVGPHRTASCRSTSRARSGGWRCRCCGRSPTTSSPCGRRSAARRA